MKGLTINTWFIKRGFKKLLNRAKATLKPSRPMTIVISFTTNPDGTIKTEAKFSKGIPYGYAITAVDRLKWDLQGRMTRKAQLAGFTSKNPHTRDFIKKQTLGDLH